MAADLATVELLASTGGFGSLGELLQQNRTPLRTIDLDTLDAGNATDYWTATSGTISRQPEPRTSGARGALSSAGESGSRTCRA
jgi:hypothetical protein